MRDIRFDDEGSRMAAHPIMVMIVLQGAAIQATSQQIHERMCVDWRDSMAHR
jgi:hypothetical protein